MNKYIAYCGLDCSKCEAYLATKNNDNKLREEVAKKWSELNKVNITAEMINCEGCKMDGVKTPFCAYLCKIRKCAINKNIKLCFECCDVKTCEDMKNFLKNGEELKELNKK